MFEGFICQQVYHESSAHNMLAQVLFLVQTHYNFAFFLFLSWKALCIAGLFSWSPRRVHAAQQWYSSGFGKPVRENLTCGCGSELGWDNGTTDTVMLRINVFKSYNTV